VRESVCERECVCARERECVRERVCVRVRERERGSVCESVFPFSGITCNKTPSKLTMSR